MKLHCNLSARVQASQAACKTRHFRLANVSWLRSVNVCFLKKEITDGSHVSFTYVLTFMTGHPMITSTAPARASLALQCTNFSKEKRSRGWLTVPGLFPHEGSGLAQSPPPPPAVSRSAVLLVLSTREQCCLLFQALDLAEQGGFLSQRSSGDFKRRPQGSTHAKD